MSGLVGVAVEAGVLWAGWDGCDFGGGLVGEWIGWALVGVFWWVLEHRRGCMVACGKIQRVGGNSG